MDYFSLSLYVRFSSISFLSNDNDNSAYYIPVKYKYVYRFFEYK